MRGFKAILSVLYPPECLICRRPTGLFERGVPETARDILCAECSIPEAAEPGSRCPRCQAEAPLFSQRFDLCLQCAYLPPWVGRVWSLYPLHGAVENCLKHYKYSGSRSFAPYLAELIANSGAVTLLAPDLIVPLPSSASQLRRRAYAHIVLLGAELSRRTKVPLSRFALESRGRRKPQVELSGAARIRNVKNRFAARPELVSGRRVLLLDDIMTSGSSVFEAARVLRECGAGTVDVLSVARSERFLRNLMSCQSRAGRVLKRPVRARFVRYFSAADESVRLSYGH